MHTKLIVLAVIIAAGTAFLWNQPLPRTAVIDQEQVGLTLFSRKSDDLSKGVVELDRELRILKNDGKIVGPDHIQRLWRRLLELWEKGALSRARAIELYQLLLDIYRMNNPPKTTGPTDTHEKATSASNDIQSLTKDVKQEIEYISGKSGGGLSETHYDALKKKLDYLTGKGVTGLERYYQIIEERSPYAIAAADKKQEAERAEQRRRQENPYYDCPTDTPPPVLTADFTDASTIQMITPPGTLTGDRDVAKGHFWIWTKGARVPLFVPVDAIFDSMSSGPASSQDSTIHYTLNFKVKEPCGFTFRFGHVTEPDTTLQAGTSLPAGSRVAYTIGNIPSGNWDIGFYNMLKKGELSKINAFGLHSHGVCLLDYYPSQKRDFYRALLDPNGPRRVCQY